MPDQRVRNILRTSLQLDNRIEQMDTDSPLLGAIPELDSMAVILIVTAMEEEFDFIIDDDEISADTFATLGSLIEFVQNKVVS